MVQSEELAAGIDPLVLWMDWIDLRSNERKYQGERARAMSRYVRTCDIFVFCHSCSLLNEDFRFKHWQNNGINGWLWKAQQRFFRKGRYRIPIWEDEEEMMEDRGEVEDKRREPEEVYILGPPRVVDPDDVEDSEDSDDSDSDFDDSDDT
ncbi:hypothetical protein BDW74DRAFT_163555 [Aspergillus multicolor]|uniref:uncharacterized protein n=1 Tax=Aspergillus multicolor TaxID=41759 RepID=UPI003CCD0D85